jgi:RNA polymerase sigma-70 factor (ECF subfamily)
VVDTKPTEEGRGGPTTPVSLLERARNRDENAWQRLVGLYQRLVLFWCDRWGVPQGDVEDLAQEVFAAVAHDLPGFRRDRPGDTFRGWLRVVSRHRVLRYFRDNKDKPAAEGGSDALRRLEEAPDTLTTPVDGEEAEMAPVYKAALDTVRGEFEEKTWQAFWLTAIEDRLVDDVTAELGMSKAAIRQAKSRVLRRVKEELGDLLE